MWLGLPPGPWPPDHYTLLNQPVGHCDPAMVESLVLTLMSRLRPHQLLHPELVTEGMNRLAQALICLTDTAARSAYDRELGKNAPEIELVPPSKPFLFAQPNANTNPLSLTVAAFPQPTTRQATETPVHEEPKKGEILVKPGLDPLSGGELGYEVVEPTPLERPGLAAELPYEVVWDAENKATGWTEGILEAELVAPPVAPWEPANRRELFSRLVLVRRYLAAWKDLKPVLGNPQEPLERPLVLLSFLESVQRAVPLLGRIPGLVGELGRPGGLVASLVRQQLVLSTFRTLLPDQRRALVLDWLRGERTLRQELAQLRERVRRGRPTRRRSHRRERIVQRVTRLFIRMPEAIILVLALLLVARFWLRNRGHA
jgi:hypothetical protein